MQINYKLLIIFFLIFVAGSKHGKKQMKGVRRSKLVKKIDVFFFESGFIKNEGGYLGGL